MRLFFTIVLGLATLAWLVFFGTEVVKLLILPRYKNRKHKK